MKPRTASFLAIFLMASSAWAEQPQDFLAQFAIAAQAENTKFSGFDAKRGELFFKSTHAADWSCSSCHTENPKNEGKHIVTEKVIKPLAPSANPERFTHLAKIEKWFKRNCNDVVKRECTAQEKGDIIAYLVSLGR